MWDIKHRMTTYVPGISKEGLRLSSGAKSEI